MWETRLSGMSLAVEARGRGGGGVLGGRGAERACCYPVKGVGWREGNFLSRPLQYARSCAPSCPVGHLL